MRMALCENMKYADGEFRRSNSDRAGSVLLGGIDGGEDDALWGRLSMEVQNGEGGVYIVHALAANERELFYEDSYGEAKGEAKREAGKGEFFRRQQKERRDFFSRAGAAVGINKGDILLYALKGRYLWIYIEAQGRGDFSCKNIRVDMVGDNFMETFPEVYRERNSFFHRYLSVMSSKYNDFTAKMKSLPSLFDVDEAPAALLEMYAGWFGINLEGSYLEEETLRRLMRELFGLVRRKGTKETIERVAEIVLGEKPVIVERNLISKQEYDADKRIIDRLYGDSPYDVYVLVKCGLSEQKRACLAYLLEQFKPVRCRLKTVFLKDFGNMDDYTYLGVNAALTGSADGVTDQNMALDEKIVIK